MLQFINVELHVVNEFWIPGVHVSVFKLTQLENVLAIDVNLYPEGIVISSNLEQPLNVLINETFAVGAEGNVILSKA